MLVFVTVAQSSSFHHAARFRRESRAETRRNFVIEGRERDARMKEMQESRSMDFVREGPPLPPAPMIQSLAIYSEPTYPRLVP